LFSLSTTGTNMLLSFLPLTGTISLLSEYVLLFDSDRQRG
jgi:hypothetical protein